MSGRGITSYGSYPGSIAADRFSLLALRRRSVAGSSRSAPSLSPISYVVPVAATLAAGSDTITPPRQLSAPTLEFPVLKIPAVTRTPQAPPPAPSVDQGAFSPAQGLSPRYAQAPGSGGLDVVTIGVLWTQASTHAEDRPRVLPRPKIGRSAHCLCP